MKAFLSLSMNRETEVTASDWSSSSIGPQLLGVCGHHLHFYGHVLLFNWRSKKLSVVPLCNKRKDVFG